MKMNRLYWSAQIFGWLGFSVCMLLAILQSPLTIWEWMMLVIPFNIIGHAIGYALYSILAKFQFSLHLLNRNIKYSFGFLIVSALLFSLAYKGCLTLILPSLDSITWTQTSAIGLLGAGIWLSLYLSIRTVKQFYVDLRTEATVQNLIRSTELDSLKSQLNPHFLFNSLNSIKALVRIDPPLAQKSIIQLSDILRKSLTISETPMIQLMDELLMMQQYLDLEKIRFDKRLTYHFKLENQSLNFRIPSMSLYLLVENAIKHGVSKLRKGGELFIHTRSEETHLYIIVRNTGVLEKKDNFYGTSLKNLERRLNHMYNGKAKLLFSEQEGMVIATLCIPIE
ncbi:sensor histidine kinase [Flectobacillus rivi]|uniref:Histidine kinase n=1 Tax=Flectobacillus rivi TaxID=2984209 RepID=A0ABT6YX02_9BACT|nr:histidine kinase [Flectobacillus rivi]MDI9873344.1 histidine kinase [Flectobacillus rivi]